MRSSTIPKKLWYQYGPWWLSGVLFAVSIIFLILGSKIHVLIWARAVGAAMLIEVVSRLTLELLWLRTRFGPDGKKFLRERMPWLVDISPQSRLYPDYAIHFRR